ncbi:F-box protein At5g10340-like [Telopea speciosissima]|uniref:F-box protein At5g10340-like n=1 Tax=Telopea speciosissima TaxID=54955 RepID=UPI001CC720EE|nr:F-box protein At5g10340-like [Telopea speciosissima]
MCYINGSVHWMIGLKNSSSSEFILSLDLELEKFKVVARPKDWAKDESYDDMMSMRLKELGGKLCVAVKVVCRQLWEIWVLKDDTNSIWSKEYQIDLEIIAVYSGIRYFPIVAFWRGKLFLESTCSLMLCYYDPITNFYEDVVKLKVFQGYVELSINVESLVTPF